MAKNAGMFPAWTHTVRSMIDSGEEVRAFCSGRCMLFPGFAVVDLARVRAVKGGDYSLINKRTRCKSCGGWVKFHYCNGVYRPLWDDATAMRWMKRDTGARTSPV